MTVDNVGVENKRILPSKKFKILYIQPGTTSFAGIERVVDTICSELGTEHGDKFDVDVLYTSVHSNRPTELRSYTVMDHITRGKVDLVRTYRAVIASKEYSLVVVPQIEPAVICMAACVGIRRKFAIYLHGNPNRERSHIKAKILFFLLKTIFIRRVSYVFGTSPRQLESFRKMFDSKVPQVWLPNPVRRFHLTDAAPITQRDFVTFVNVGRFSYQKGQDILLEAFSEIAKQKSNVKLKIVGYGAGESELLNQINRLNLDAVVSIEHFPDSPQEALEASDIYVSTSRWEGWSLAICEALRFGLPVISTDCEFGPSDILIDKRLGRLVPPSGGAELVKAMLYYCENLEKEARHAEYRKEFVDRFDVRRVIDVHAEALLAAAF